MLPEHTRESFLCGHMLSVEIARLYGNSTLTFEELPIHFTQWLYHFPFPPAVPGVQVHMLTDGWKQL